MVVLLAGGGLLLTLLPSARYTHLARSSNPAHFHMVQRQDYALWTEFEGTLQAERRAPLYSRISQATTITYLAPEGHMVRSGERVAELDRSITDQTLATLERDHALADAELRVLINADIPGELEELTHDLSAVEYELHKQRRVLSNTEMLHGKGLISDPELEAQQMLADSLHRRVEGLKRKQRSLLDVVNPARETKARAQLDAATRQLKVMQEQVEGAQLIAPFAGMVVYLPLHIGGEYRTVREGDTVHRNQKILQIDDMESLVVQCYVPESSISLVRPGAQALATPMAFPALRLSGRVESVGSTALTVSGRPAGQRFFNVLVKLDATDERLRSNMSVYVQILAHQQSDALLVPRGFVGWERGEPWCLVQESGGYTRRAIEVASGNESHFLIASGLSEGDRIRLPGTGL